MDIIKNEFGQPTWISKYIIRYLFPDFYKKLFQIGWKEFSVVSKINSITFIIEKGEEK